MPVSPTIPQAILDGLTDVAMPRLPPERAAREFIEISGFRLPAHRAQALVVGSGAAGLRAAVELKRRRVDVFIGTQSAWGGTSACSGSDKQTLHTANSADQGDDFRALAQAIGAGGAMDGDTAYVEAVSSLRCNSSACRCRSTASAACCAIRPITTSSAARRVAARALRG